MCIVHPLRPDDPAIFGCAQAGCRECLEALLERHEGLVHYVVRNQIWGGVPEDDLLQEGRIACGGRSRGMIRSEGQRFPRMPAWRSTAVWEVTATRTAL